MAATRDETIKEITLKYLANISQTNNPGHDVIARDIIENVEIALGMENAVRSPGNKWKVPHALLPVQIADCMLTTMYVKRIAYAGLSSPSEYDMLAIYQEDGPDKGLYVSDDKSLNELIRKWQYDLKTADIAEIKAALYDKAERAVREDDPDLIAVNNGIFNYKTKKLEDFSPDRVFVAKSRVSYDPNAANIVIHNNDDNTDWDVESWMNELSDDPEIVEVLWQILGAIIRPGVRWEKSAWFYSTTGNNGKGTLCELMRNLCGEGAYASIPLTEFSRDFMLEPLTHASAIIVDENDVGGFVDKAANLKAIITNDVIQLNRKFKSPITYQFKGFMVQCLNEFPRVKDRSDSFYRRQLFIPFEKCFTGQERRYIKSDYLHRPAVLEYVLKRVLHMDYNKLSEPQSCRDILDLYKDYNDPVRQFAEEMLPQCVWDLLPFSFLYDLYKAWLHRTSPSNIIQGKSTFITDIVKILADFPDWYCLGTKKAIKPAHRMDATEPLIIAYNLSDWKNDTYMGFDKDKICNFERKQTYNGILRLSPGSGSSNSSGLSDEPDDKS